MKTRHLQDSRLAKLLRLDGISVFVPLSISLFIFYILNSSSSVFGGDSGDFLAAIAANGVPHPSGYPLYTMIGILLSKLPIAATLAWKVGIGSAFFSALAVGFEYLIVFRIWKNKLYALVTSLTLAFVFPFWLYSEHVEVFALHHFFITVLFFVALLYRQTKNVKFLYLCAFVSGLSLTNNESIILLFPAVFVLVIPGIIKNKRILKSMILSFIFFIFGLLPYVYVPIAASFHPAVNWNNALNLNNFIHLVLRKDYGWVATTKVGPAIKSVAFNEYFFYLLSELPFLSFVTISLGVVAAWLTKKDRVIVLALLLSFILFGPFFINYAACPCFDTFSQGVREKFLASSLIFFVLFIPFGIDSSWQISKLLFKRIEIDKKRLDIYYLCFSLFFMIIPAILLFKNISVLNLSSVRITDQAAKDILSPLPKQSVLIAQHDNIVFPAWYIQQSQGVQKSVYVTLPKELEGMAKRGMLHLTKPSIFRPENRDSISDSIAYSLSVPVFISETDYHTVVSDGKILLYPYGMVWKYANDSKDQLAEKDFLAIQNKRLSELSDPSQLISDNQRDRLWLLSNFSLFYSHAYTNTGYFLMYAYHDYQLARKYFEKAISIDGRDDWAYEGLGIAFYKQKDYQKAREAFAKAIEIQPLNHNAYFLLYGSTVALGDKKGQKELEDFFAKYKMIYTEFQGEKTRVKLPPS